MNNQKQIVSPDNISVENTTMNTEVINKNFTLFGKGYWSNRAKRYVPSVKPVMEVDIRWVGEYILSDRAKPQTLELRSMIGKADDQQLRDYKLLNFDAVAAAGTFYHGSAAGLIMRSPYIVLDVDDLASTEEARKIQHAFVADSRIETTLCFVSPKGLGVKWWVVLPEWCQGLTFAQQYTNLSHYVAFEYGLKVDPSGSNVNRLCFLPHDNECFINKKYL